MAQYSESRDHVMDYVAEGQALVKFRKVWNSLVPSSEDQAFNQLPQKIIALDELLIHAMYLGSVINAPDFAVGKANVGKNREDARLAVYMELQARLENLVSQARLKERQLARAEDSSRLEAIEKLKRENAELRNTLADLPNPNHGGAFQEGWEKGFEAGKQYKTAHDEWMDLDSRVMGAQAKGNMKFGKEDSEPIEG